MERLRNKAAVITGAGRGIGRAAAELFAREGANVVIAEINEELGDGAAQARNAGNVDVTVPEGERDNLIDFISRIEALPVLPDAAAKVVINERTGTVVIGQNVRVLPVAVSHGSLSVEVRADIAVSQPPPFSPGATVVAPQATVDVQEEPDRLIAIPEQNTIEEVVRALKPIRTSSLPQGSTRTSGSRRRTSRTPTRASWAW